VVVENLAEGVASPLRRTPVAQEALVEVVTHHDAIDLKSDLLGLDGAEATELRDCLE